MQYNQYIKLVKERALFVNDDDTIQSIRAVLETLGQRLASEQADGLAALLPKELKPYLKQSKKTKRFGLNDFLSGVGKKEGVDPAAAKYHAEAVFSVLASAVPTAELIHALSELPVEMRNLFGVENGIKRAA